MNPKRVHSIQSAYTCWHHLSHCLHNNQTHCTSWDANMFYPILSQLSQLKNIRFTSRSENNYQIHNHPPQKGYPFTMSTSCLHSHSQSCWFASFRYGIFAHFKPEHMSYPPEAELVIYIHQGKWDMHRVRVAVYIGYHGKQKWQQKSSWWFGSFPPSRDENKTYLKPPPRNVPGRNGTCPILHSCFWSSLKRSTVTVKTRWSQGRRKKKQQKMR